DTIVQSLRALRTGQIPHAFGHCGPGRTMMSESLERPSTSLNAGAAVAQQSGVGAAATSRPTGDTSIRPFRFHAPDDALADLRRRIIATKWPSRETVPDASQG